MKQVSSDQRLDLLPMVTGFWTKSCACMTAQWFVFFRISSALLAKIDVDPDCRYSVFVSFVEIYNEQVYDLLEPSEKKGRTSILLSLLILQSGLIRHPKSVWHQSSWLVQMNMEGCLCGTPPRLKCAISKMHYWSLPKGMSIGKLHQQYSIIHRVDLMPSSISRSSCHSFHQLKSACSSSS